MKKLTISTLLAFLIVMPSMIVFSQSLHEPYKQSVCLMKNYQATNPLDGVKSIFSEDFSSGTFPPAGWSVMGDGTDNWSAEETNNAGGIAPEVRFFWSPNFVGNSRLVTTTIATSGYSTVLLSFKHFLDDFGAAGSYTIYVETTSDGGTTWNEVWSVEDPGANIGPEEKFLLISNGDVGSDNFQIAFRFDGDSYELDWWNIDDVVLGESLMYDAEASAIIIPSLVPAGDVVTPIGVVTNKGSETITFDVNFSIVESGASAYNEDLTVTDLAPFESQTLTFPDWTSYEGSFDAILTTNLTGDENPGNDQLTESLEAIAGVIFTKPLYEEFTSSTCGPCAAANPILDAVLAANQGTHSLIKYQMDWPGSGDPYYTEEGGARKDYYSVGYVPDMYINSFQTYPGDMTQAIYDSYIGLPTAMEIDVATAEIDDNYNITVTANIDVVAAYAAGLTAHIVVVEKITVGNVGSNGETEFYNVMMKMLPDASGTMLPALTPGTTESITETYDMSLTFMEEPNDLAVIVFVQDDNDKSLIQSEQADVQGVFVAYDVTFNVEDELGNIIEGAEVFLEGNGTLFTNTAGQVLYEGVFPGTYNYDVSAAGFFSTSGTVEVVDQDVTVNVILEAPVFYFFEMFDTGIPADWTIHTTGWDYLYWYDGKVIFFRQSGTNNPLMLVSPAINIDPANMLYFDAGEQNGNPIISFGTVTDPTDPNTFTELTTYLPGPEWETFEYDLAGLKDIETDVYFAWKLNISDYSFFSFDNVILTSCGGANQVVELEVGYQFISSRIEVENPDMLVVLQDILNENLDFVRNSQGTVLRKIGPNWVNGIGDWNSTEGYLFKMFGAESLEFFGVDLDPLTPIGLQAGYQFVSYLPNQSIDALYAFDGILDDNLDYIRSSSGEMLRKIGPNWVNGIGDANPGEGYLIKMFAEAELVYNIPVKSTLSSLTPEIANNFAFEGGNAADPVYTIYVSGLNIGDEVAVLDGKKIVGTAVVVSENVLENSIPVFSTLTNGQGYESNNMMSLRIWDAEKQSEVSAIYTFNNEYTDAYAKTVFPENDGEFSVINVTKGNIGIDANALSEVSIYPNPATDMINISSHNPINNVVIFNYVGQPVYEGNNTQINTSNFDAGVYIIRIETYKGIETQKVAIK